MKKESILYGTLILMITNAFVKVLSLIYRGITVRLIGAEGLGLMEMMMPLYSLLIVISSLGIPPAMSNMISAERDLRERHSIVKTGSILLVISSILIIVVTLIFLPFLAEIIFTDERIIPGFFVLIPSIFLISVFSSLRGYFQGSHQSSLLGKSQLAEQMIRITAGVFLLMFLIHRNAPLPVILMGAALASFIAEFGGGIYLYLKYYKQKPKRKGSFQKQRAKEMLHSGAPITMSRLTISATAAIQSIIVPQALILQGATHDEAAAFFGLFAGVALTVLHLPSIVTGALITPLIPAIADANSRSNHRLRNSRISKSILFTNITAFPILFLLFYYANEICTVLFATPEAGPILKVLCLGGIFLYLQQPIIGILQGMNRFYPIFIHYCIADVIYIASLIFLMVTNTFCIKYFLYSFILNDFLVFILNFIYLKKITGFKTDFKNTYFAPIISLCGGGIILIFFEKCIMQTNITNILSMTLSACLFLLCYIFTLYLNGALDKETISSLLS